MNITNLRTGVPNAPGSVLAHRLGWDLTPPRWVINLAKLARLLGAGLVALAVARTLVTFLVQYPLIATVVFWGTFTFGTVVVAGWLEQFEPRISRWIWLAVRNAAPLTATFRGWDDLVDRLAQSPARIQAGAAVVAERDHILLGMVHGSPWPVLHDISRPSHTLVTGVTSSGKSHRLLLPSAVQILRRRTASIVVVDLKGDRAFFTKMALEAKRAKMNFRWYSFEPGCSSYVFNVFTQRLFSRLTIPARVQLLAQALGLDAEGRQDEAFFSALNERVLRRLYEQVNPRSFAELLRAAEDPAVVARLDIPEREWQLAMHLRATLDRMVSAAALNACPGEPGVDQTVLSAAIDPDALLSRPEVVYFWLPVTIERTVARVTGRLVLQAIVAAARTHPGTRVPLHLFVDEFQEIVGTSAVSSLLRQGREFDISFWLAHQQLDDLRRGAHDSLASVTGNVALQVHFTATDQTGHDHLVRSSGGTTRWLNAVNQDGEGVDRPGRREALTTRLDSESVSLLNADPSIAAALFAPTRPLAPFRHTFYLRTCYTVSAQVAARLKASPWPRPTRFTVVNPLPIPAAPPEAARPAQVAGPAMSEPPLASGRASAAVIPPPPNSPPNTPNPASGEPTKPTEVPRRRGKRSRPKPDACPPADISDLEAYLRDLRAEDTKD